MRGWTAGAGGPRPALAGPLSGGWVGSEGGICVDAAAAKWDLRGPAEAPGTVYAWRVQVDWWRIEPPGGGRA
jgi:hypothetical protein